MNRFPHGHIVPSLPQNITQPPDSTNITFQPIATSSSVANNHHSHLPSTEQSEGEYHRQFTFWWSMGDQNINAIWNLFPFVTQCSASRQVECPATILWLPGMQQAS